MVSSDQYRSFIALQPSAAQAASICQWAKQNLPTLPKDVALYSPEKLHLTLAFLGQRSMEFLQQLSQALQHIQPSLSQVIIAPYQLKLFPCANDPQYLALMAEPNLSLLDLLAKVEQVLLKLGVESEARIFRPHITLAKLDSSSFEANGDQSPLPMSVNLPTDISQTVTLFHSQLDHTGSIYQPVFSLNLTE
ncbi:RNA 2',3'-cyclic phosphodiesterase [Pelagibaculum spongiae]|uniref:RNA 2',3'-cyclic phosphodiesterase n=1 Tax=Pelagibaculum spongiae TaxID=2080658 RepID=A0A2V1GVD5_9GAMM|nr:RNA 2',3'-cyclic phosphodiesterase [Pelagibaculum spongiae]PVZ69651.1 RNA 2',3'-cyclic phosphodiesterase [Pelagibaculum spongiae]